MSDTGVDVVTGAFGFSGSLIAERLLAAGRTVRTLTDHPRGNHPLADRVKAAPLNFANLPALIAALQGATTLYNTYWIRFPHGSLTYEMAVRNSRQLFLAAQEAGVQRIVHVSISNPSPTSPLPYFRGKALVEAALQASGISHAILRPTVLFGDGAILINNIAWVLRRFPVFLVPGDGRYRLQPIAVQDLADLAVAAGEKRENSVIEAGGPEVLAFEDLLKILAALLESPVALMHVPPPVALLATRGMGALLGDVMLTPDELAGLQADLLVAPGPPMGTRMLTEWLAQNRMEMGREYYSELKRHYHGRKKTSKKVLTKR